MKWYQLSTEEVLKKCRTRLEGLTEFEVEERRKEFGPNPTSWPHPISRHFFTYLALF